MKKWVKIIGFLGLLGLGAALYGYFFIYNKPHPDYLTLEADDSLTAEMLFKSFRSDAVNAAQQYNGKMLLVSGNLSQLETADSTTIAYFILGEGMFGNEGVRVSMLPSEISKLNGKTGQNIQLKAYCTGFNDTDVILEHGSFQ